MQLSVKLEKTRLTAFHSEQKFPLIVFRVIESSAKFNIRPWMSKSRTVGSKTADAMSWWKTFRSSLAPLRMDDEKTVCERKRKFNLIEPITTQSIESLLNFA
jgi:hypothetical protein